MRISRSGRKRPIEKAAKNRRLDDKFAELVRSLTAINADVGHSLHFQIFADGTPDEATANRRDAIGALNAVEYFLFSQHVSSTALQKLRSELLAVEFRGERPAMLQPQQRNGRKPDKQSVQSLKGRLAGMAYAKMQSGMDRGQAASWVARNIPTSIARRISSKPIYKSTILEWMEKFGCSLRIRRELKSLRTEEELKQFLDTKGRLHEIDGNFGELHCLIMMFTERKRLATDPPFRWAHYWSEIPEEPMTSSRAGGLNGNRQRRF